MYICINSCSMRVYFLLFKKDDVSFVDVIFILNADLKMQYSDFLDSYATELYRS